MKQLIIKHGAKLRFLVVGGTNTVIDFGILFILVSFGIDRIAGNYISTTIAFIFSFFANRSFTFKSKDSIRKQFLPFAVVTLTGLWIIQPIVIIIVSEPLKYLITDSKIILLIAKLLATIVSLIWNYLLYSRLVFKTNNSSDNTPKS